MTCFISAVSAGLGVEASGGRGAPPAAAPSGASSSSLLSSSESPSTPSGFSNSEMGCLLPLSSEIFPGAAPGCNCWGSPGGAGKASSPGPRKSDDIVGVVRGHCGVGRCDENPRRNYCEWRTVYRHHERRVNDRRRRETSTQVVAGQQGLRLLKRRAAPTRWGVWRCGTRGASSMRRRWKLRCAKVTSGNGFWP